GGTVALHDALPISLASLNDAVKHYQEAGSEATKLASELRSSSANLTSDNPLKKSMDTIVSAYNVNVFKRSQGDATLALAQLEASQAQALAERQHLVKEL